MGRGIEVEGDVDKASSEGLTSFHTSSSEMSRSKKHFLDFIFQLIATKPIPLSHNDRDIETEERDFNKLIFMIMPWRRGPDDLDFFEECSNQHPKTSQFRLFLIECACPLHMFSIFPRFR